MGRSARVAIHAISLALSACAFVPGVYEVQAPYDSYVCFNSSFSQCLQNPQLANANSFRSGVYSRYFVPGTATIQDAGANTVTYTSDKKYLCNNSNVPYSQTLSQVSTFAIVYVSPTLLNQIGDDLAALDRVRLGCMRLVTTYNFQLTTLQLQDQQSTAQKASQYLSSMVEFDNLSFGKNPNTTVKDTLTTDQMTQFGATTPSSGSLALPDVLQGERQLVTQTSEQLRNNIKAQTLNIDFKNKFDDAQLAIDLQLRLIAKELLLLDSAGTVIPRQDIEQTYYLSGTWVQKGSVVMSMVRRTN